jgi:hypothetical protein
VDIEEVRARLRHVRWLGGGSGAGKSTVARALAARHGLPVYATDDVMAEHAVRCAPEECPSLREFVRMTMDERWVHRPPEVMLETFHWFRGEGFPLIVDDLLRLPEGPVVLAEGFRLLPHLVAPLLSDPRHAVWLLPTPQFRQAAFEARGSLWDIAGRTSDPPAAVRNLLERDQLFTDRLRDETRALGLHVVDVEMETLQPQLEARVATALGLDQ